MAGRSLIKPEFLLIVRRDSITFFSEFLNNGKDELVDVNHYHKPLYKRKKIIFEINNGKDELVDVNHYHKPEKERERK